MNGAFVMRTVSGAQSVQASAIDGQNSQGQLCRAKPESFQQQRPDRIVRPVTRINGQRIHFADLARMAWPQKTEANLAHATGYDPRTCRRWLADDTEPPAEALAAVLAEIMRCAHKRV